MKESFYYGISGRLGYCRLAFRHLAADSAAAIYLEEIATYHCHLTESFYQALVLMDKIAVAIQSVHPRVQL
jgi:hypothetical protein